MGHQTVPITRGLWPFASHRSPLHLFYNVTVKSWDVIVAGGGIIGLSLAIELKKRGTQVLLVERAEPGREASSAAAGMLVDHPDETPIALQALATASSRMYPEFVHQLQDESEVQVDLRDQGALVFSDESRSDTLPPADLAALEPALGETKRLAIYVKERSVDPRSLVAAALKAAKHRGVDISSGGTVTDVLLSEGRVSGIRTERTHYKAPVVVNCAGAWAGQWGPVKMPTRPVKGQMLAVIGHGLLRHVIRVPKRVYLVPRSDGRILIGSTLEDAGFDKRTDAETIQRLHRNAAELIPALGEARVLEAWAGLRPGTPDELPILGATKTQGYFVATGHFRDGILLAPVTARLMAQVVSGERPEYEIGAFSAERFS